MAKETYYKAKKRPINTSIPRVCANVKRDLINGKRGLKTWKKRPINTRIPEVCVSVKRDLLYGKRYLFILQKRPINTSIPEVCVSVKRDLHAWQKRPIHMGKEAYSHDKRGLFTRQKWPNNLLAHLRIPISRASTSFSPFTRRLVKLVA